MNRNELKELYRTCVEVVSDRMQDASDGDSDGVFFFFDRPIEVEINLNEKLLGSLRDKERAVGVFFSYVRTCPADCIIVDRNPCLLAERLPRYSEELLVKMRDRLESMKRREKISPVPLRWLTSDIAVIPKGLTATRFVSCSMGRIASVAAELSHCRVFR